jgi:hypothetical protein
MGVRRIQAAGAVPITWLAVAAEWQRDWARENDSSHFRQKEYFSRHGREQALNAADQRFE